LNAPLVIGVSALAAIFAVTFVCMTYLQQLVDIFYTATVNAIVIAAIIVGAATWMHRKLTTVSYEQERPK
jgi:hypothetical protein